MAIIRLVLKRPVANARREPVFVPASATLSRTYFPTRGVFYSLALHAVGFTLLNLFAYFPIAPPPEAERPREQIVMIDLNDPLALMYFPLEPEDEAPAPPGKKAEPQREEPSGTPAATTRGFSYPGPQLIVSDVPEPTNEFQTILQPDIENPPVLPPPVAVPNIVQLAEVNIPPPMEEPPEEPAVEEEAPQPQETGTGTETRTQTRTGTGTETRTEARGAAQAGASACCSSQGSGAKARTRARSRSQTGAGAAEACSQTCGDTETRAEARTKAGTKAGAAETSGACSQAGRDAKTET